MDTTAIYFSQTLSANLTRSSAVKNPDMKNPALSEVIHTIVLPIAASSLIKMSAVQPATVTFSTAVFVDSICQNVSSGGLA